MIGQALLFFVDIQFLDIVDQLLFQAIAVIVHTGQFCQTFFQALSDFLYAALFEGFDFFHQCFDARQILFKLFCQGFTFLRSELHQFLCSHFHQGKHFLPFLFAQLFHCYGLHHVGHTHQHTPHVSTIHSDTMCLAHVLHLSQVIAHHIGIDRSCRRGSILFYPKGKVHLAALQLL